MDSEENRIKLEEIAKQVKVCKCCKLYKTATRGVPGTGNPVAKIMFIGEGPGYHEDQQGLPFVGQAGKLLDQLLQSIKLDRKSVFIGNVVKHRCPDNRDPLPDEIEACKVWLDQQIEIIQPEIVVTLGRFSMNKFLPNEFISKTHGQSRFVEFQNRKIIVIPMYHPAAALRNGNIITSLRSDFLKILNILQQKKVSDESESVDKKKKDNREQLNLI